jgi:hypothetical protein
MNDIENQVNEAKDLLEKFSIDRLDNLTEAKDIIEDLSKELY